MIAASALGGAKILGRSDLFGEIDANLGELVFVNGNLGLLPQRAFEVVHQLLPTFTEQLGTDLLADLSLIHI